MSRVDEEQIARRRAKAEDELAIALQQRNVAWGRCEKLRAAGAPEHEQRAAQQKLADKEAKRAGAYRAWRRVAPKPEPRAAQPEKPGDEEDAPRSLAYLELMRAGSAREPSSAEPTPEIDSAKLLRLYRPRPELPDDDDDDDL